MRFALTLAALVLAATTADAQVFGRGRSYSYPSCPGGVCPAPQQFGAPLTSPQSAPIGVPPSSAHEWGIIPGYGYGWKLKDVAAPKVMEASPGVPRELIASYGVPSAAKPMHGERAYRIIRAFSERQLADEAMKKGYKPAEARAKARELVGKLTNQNIDEIGVKMAGVSEGIGDGVVGDRIDNIIRIIDAIMKLLMLFLVIDDGQPMKWFALIGDYASLLAVL